MEPLVYQRTAGPLGPVLKKILEDRSVQDLKIAKRTSKDLFFDSGSIISVFQNSFLEILMTSLLNPPNPYSS